jgi:hypothetical protein
VVHEVAEIIEDHAVLAFEERNPYWRWSSPCAFLKDGECQIYELRPISCRKYLNFAHPDACVPGSKNKRLVAPLEKATLIAPAIILNDSMGINSVPLPLGMMAVLSEAWRTKLQTRLVSAEVGGIEFVIYEGIMEDEKDLEGQQHPHHSL